MLLSTSLKSESYFVSFLKTTIKDGIITLIFFLKKHGNIFAQIIFTLKFQILLIIRK